MENENSENKDSQKNSVQAVVGGLPVTGQLNNPHVLERLKAVAKSTKKSIKSRHTIQTTETVKVATSFGATNAEVYVEKEVKVEPKTNEEKKAALEAELDAQMKQKLGDAALPVDEEKLAKAKEIRDNLAGLWTIQGLPQDEAKERADRRQADSHKYIDADQYIEGIPPLDENSASVNPNAGDSGVRIKFTSKPKN